MALESQQVRIVRDEDIDWTVYHLITGEKGCTKDMLINRTGYDREVIELSLARLARYCLIDCRNDTWCCCSPEETILKKQLSGILSDGLELSGGVIRYRPTGEEQS
jgi:hypothetical protein